jgi:hypothetical protein
MEKLNEIEYTPKPVPLLKPEQKEIPYVYSSYSNLVIDI